MQLTDTQRAFSNALFDAQTESGVIGSFNGDAQLVRQRIALYRANMGATWDKVLAIAYPVLRTLVGDEFFGGLARAYGAAYPSTAGDLNIFGAHFSAFLRDFPHVADYPYFPDMARLEWALHRAHYADEAQSINPAELMQLAPGELDEARLSLHPACQLIAFDWDVVELWRAHQSSEPPVFPAQMQRVSHGLVFRPHWKVDVLPLTAAEYALLFSLHQGGTFGASIDAALEIDADFDLGSPLQHWLKNAIFSTIHLSEMPSAPTIT
jgi:hypothetical protein